MIAPGSVGQAEELVLHQIGPDALKIISARTRSSASDSDARRSDNPTIWSASLPCRVRSIDGQFVRFIICLSATIDGF
jgi:hypothetical protein